MSTSPTDGIYRVSTRPTRLTAMQWNPSSDYQTSLVHGFLSGISLVNNRINVEVHTDSTYSDTPFLRIYDGDGAPMLVYSEEWILLTADGFLNVLSDDAFESAMVIESAYVDPGQPSLF